MPHEDVIEIRCPSCTRRFRVKSSAVMGSSKNAVKCPGCGGAIPLPRDTAHAESDADRTMSVRRKARTQIGAPGPSAQSDDELRSLLRKAKKRKRGQEHSRETLRKTTGSGPPPGPPIDDPDETQPTANVPEDTHPDEDIALTMPVGSAARTAESLGTSQSPAQVPSRPRLETPRAGAQMASPVSRAGARMPSPLSVRHEPDEPTYTGPMPGRAPMVTPTEHDLAKFLVPGNYMVRVEDVVYSPVSHDAVAELVDRGVLLGVDEIAAEDGLWTAIAGQGPLDGLRERLSHRAHHMLARVADGRPASDFGRPPPEPAMAFVDASYVGPMPQPPSDISDASDASDEPAEPFRTGHAPPETAAIPIADLAPTTPRRKQRLLIGVVSTFAVLLGVFAVILLPLGRGSSSDGDGALDDDGTIASAAATPAIVEREEVDPVPAYLNSKATVGSALEVAKSLNGMLAAAKEAGPEDLVTTLSWMKWRRSPEAIDGHDLMRRLMKRGDYRQARQLANYLLTVEGKSKELETLVEESIEKQFAEETVVEITDDRFMSIVRVEPGARPALVLEDEAGKRWFFWPDLGKSSWRGDIAVYRLCQLMVCHFAIPETREATLHRDVFDRLVERSTGQHAEVAAKLRSDFAWKGDVLRGSFRQEAAGARWPLEATGIWRPWLTAGTGTSKLEMPTYEDHYSVAFFGADKVVAELDGITARDLGRQVSDILLVDYLVGNYNRFAATEEEYGSRTHIDDGLILSVEDTAAFLSEDSVRVRGRFSWSSRFSKVTIDSLRNLDRDLVDRLLFPSASKTEKEKLEAFWRQRKKALRRVDQLVKKYGAKDVFALDAPRE